MPLCATLNRLPTVLLGLGKVLLREADLSQCEQAVRSYPGLANLNRLRGIVGGHLQIADNVVISGCTGVFHSIDKAGVYTGAWPAMPHREWQQAMSGTRRLRELQARIRALENSTNRAGADQNYNDSDGEEIR